MRAIVAVKKGKPTQLADNEVGAPAQDSAKPPELRGIPETSQRHQGATVIQW